MGKVQWEEKRTDVAAPPLVFHFSLEFRRNEGNLDVSGGKKVARLLSRGLNSRPWEIRSTFTRARLVWSRAKTVRYEG